MLVYFPSFKLLRCKATSANSTGVLLWVGYGRNVGDRGLNFHRLYLSRRGFLCDLLALSALWHGLNKNLKAIDRQVYAGDKSMKRLLFSSVAAKPFIAVVLIIVLTTSLSVGIYFTAFAPDQSNNQSSQPTPTPTQTAQTSPTPQPTTPSPTASPTPNSSTQPTLYQCG
jgi:hypothetical protein